MYTTRDSNGVIASTASAAYRHALRIAPLTALLATVTARAPDLLRASESTRHCDVAFEADHSYPPLPEADGPDLSGEPGVLIHLQRERGVVELGDCLYELNRPLEVDFSGLSQIELLFDLPGAELGARVFVTDASGMLEDFEVYGGTFGHTMTASDELGFEVAPLLQTAPTVPVVVTRPIEDDPEPN